MNSAAELPALLSPRFDSMPAELTSRVQWVVWRAVWQPEKAKYSKVPHDAKNGRAASSTDPATWATFAQARAAYEADKAKYAGVGFVLSESDPFAGVDLDHTVHEKEATPEGRAVLDRLNSYTEVSPSGTGLRVFLIANLPPGGRKKGDTEMYEAGRFLTVTGRRLPGTPAEVNARQSEIEAFHAETFPAPAPKAAPTGPTAGLPDSDTDLLALAFKAKNGPKIAALYGGDISGYAGASEADLALCSLLAFWTGDDPARLDGLFKASGLMREKWNEPHYAGGVTYGARTCEKGIEQCRGTFYTPKGVQMRMGGLGGKKGAAAADGEASGEPEFEAEPDNGEGRGPSVATRLVEIARERFTLWHTPERKAYATVPTADGHNETWEVESTGFRDQLARIYFAESGKAIAPAAMQAAVSMLGTFSRLEGAERDIYIRKADLSQAEGAIYLDLCNDKWQAVKITTSGWEVVDNPPVPFRRTRGMRPLPMPETGGKLADLRQFVNMPAEGDGGDILIFAWLLAALGPHTSYPILHLMGEQGSAKTWAGRFLRALVDPSHPDLRREPKEDRDLAIAGTNAFIVAFDNVSSFPLWLSDTLCTIATGGGFGTRKLHSDDDEALFSFKCPVLMTGIGEASTKGDFLQRSLLVSLPVVSEEGRKAEADVVPAFEAAKPKLLGALLDAVSCGLRNLATTRLAESPRMADFARWVSACEAACPWPAGEFLEAYKDNQATGGETALDADKIAPLIVRLVSDQYDQTGKWKGTAADLMDALSNLIGDKDKSGLPKNARALMVGVKRIAPALRAEKGIDFTGPAKSNGKKIYTFTAGAQKSKTGSQTGSQNDNYSTSKTAFDEGEFETGPQRPQRPQNSAHSTYADFESKKKEKEEREGETNEEYNRRNFAAFATLRPDAPKPLRDSGPIANLLAFVQREYHGTGIDVRAAFGYIVRVENERITGLWNGPLGGKLAFGMDYFLPVNEPFPADAPAVATNKAEDDGPSLYDDPFADGEEL